IWGIAFFIICSCLASLGAAIVAFKIDHKSAKKFVLFGLFNFATLIGFAIATVFTKTKIISPELKKKLRDEGVIIWDNRKLFFVFLFTVFFMVLTVIFENLLRTVI
ncbi:MAG: hypothetical protein ABIG30_00790, partial [Candidatus Aenigmatarchaeota archaeon]